LQCAPRKSLLVSRWQLIASAKSTTRCRPGRCGTSLRASLLHVGAVLTLELAATVVIGVTVAVAGEATPSSSCALYAVQCNAVLQTVFSDPTVYVACLRLLLFKHACVL
jgi:hypothetical protein